MIYLSLKTKLMLLAALLMVCLGGYFSLHSDRQLNRLFDTLRDDAFVRHQKEMQALLQRSAATLLQLSDSLPHMEESGGQNLVEVLDSQWESMQINWGVESATLYDVEGQALRHWGDRSFYQPEKVLTISSHLRPGSEIVCSHRCVQRSIAPILPDIGQLLVLQLEVSLADLLRTFNDVSGADLVVLTRSPTDKLTDEHNLLWGWRISALTHREQQLPLLRQMERQYTFAELERGSILFTAAGRIYEMGLLPIDQSNPTASRFLVVQDFSLQQQFVSDSLRSFVTASAISVGLSALLVVVLSWRFTARLRLHARLMPMLVSGRFEYVREQLRRRRFRFLRDEIDVLDQAGVDVSTRLQAMHERIEQDTSSLEVLAMYDDLTGMPNRNLLHKKLREAVQGDQREARDFVLINLDIDHFKSVNDFYGHHFGDELLKAVAGRLRNYFDEQDFVAHLSSNTFVVLLRGLKRWEDDRAIADYLMSAFEPRFHIDSVSLAVNVSAGMIAWPRDAVSMEGLLQGAELAMYAAKDQGRDRMAIYQPAMSEAVQKTLELEKELKQALDHGEFFLRLQPQVDMVTRKIISAEALVRWQHPQRGELSPFHFIDTMEEVGLIARLDDYVLEQSCQHLQHLLEQDVEPITIAVNLSAQKFADPNLVTQVSDLLSHYRIDPRHLELEITESMAMQDVDVSQKMIARLRQLGITLAIDDFGTGYSSLSYLKTLNIDILKIDQSFVRDLPDDRDDAAIATAIIAMAHKLNLRVVAEGVETEGHYHFLREQGCDVGQGYLFSKPIRVEEVLVSLHEQVTNVTGLRQS